MTIFRNNYHLFISFFFVACLTPNVALADAISEKYGFTLDEEKEIGLQAAAVVLKNYPLYTNENVSNYVSHVGYKVVKALSSRPEIEYTFFVLETDEINAFALPGGIVFITTGALKVMGNEAELAAILAHEVAHVDNGHCLQAINNFPDAKERIGAIKAKFKSGEGLYKKPEDIASVSDLEKIDDPMAELDLFNDTFETDKLNDIPSTNNLDNQQ